MLAIALYIVFKFVLYLIGICYKQVETVIISIDGCFSIFLSGFLAKVLKKSFDIGNDLLSPILYFSNSKWKYKKEFRYNFIAFLGQLSAYRNMRRAKLLTVLRKRLTDQFRILVLTNEQQLVQNIKSYTSTLASFICGIKYGILS